MANIEKRVLSDGTTMYRVKVRLKGFPVQTATFERLTDARKWGIHTESAIEEGRHFKTSKLKKYTLGELIDKYIKEILPLKKNITVNQRCYLKWWKDRIGYYVVAEVSASLIKEYTNKLVGEKNQYGREKGASTANRYTTALGRLFTIAVNEGWSGLENNPVRKIEKLPEPRGRVRFLSEDERVKLLEVCKKSENPYLYIITILALSNGARKNEILNLQWKDLDLKRGTIILHETKNDERRCLPIKGYVHSLLEQHSKIRNLQCNYVFSNENKCQPIDIRTAWENALKKSKIEDFRFHDLRHSAASYLAMNGASLVEIAEVLGYKTLQMVKRYAHLSEAHTASHG